MHHNTPTEPEKTLTPKQLAAIPLLAQGQSIAKVAASIGTHESTIDRWKRQASFMAALADAEEAIFAAHLKMLKKTVSPAIACLVRNMQDGKPYVQVAAASKLLDLALDVHRMEVLEARVAELEEIIRSQDGS